MASPAKKLASMEAAYAEAMGRTAQAVPMDCCVDASGARIRTVAVHRTEFAKGCSKLTLADPKRWTTLYGVSPRRALAKTLGALGVRPGAVVVTAQLSGVQGPDINLCVERDGQLVTLATVWDGLTEDEVKDAVRQLVTESWEAST